MDTCSSTERSASVFHFINPAEGLSFIIKSKAWPEMLRSNSWGMYG